MLAGQNTYEFTGVMNFPVNGIEYNCFQNFYSTDIAEAAFADLDIKIVGGLKVNAGVRYEHSVVDHQDELLGGPLDGLTYSKATLPDSVGNPVTPKYGLTWQINEQDMVYISAAKGYRAGGGTPANAVQNPLCGPSLSALGISHPPESYNSDSVWSYEFGTKDSFFDRRLVVEGSVYRIDWSDIQTSVPLPSCALVFTANRGKAVIQGFDLQVSAVPVEGVKLGLAVGYTNAYHPDGAYGAPSNGITPLLNAPGDKLPNVVPWTVAPNAQYTHDVSELWNESKGYVRLDFRWQSAANALNPAVAGFDPMTGPRQNPAYGILNVRVGVIHGGLDLSTFVNNATHEDPVLQYSHEVVGEQQIYAASHRPIYAGLTGYYRW